MSTHLVGSIVMNRQLAFGGFHEGQIIGVPGLIFLVVVLVCIILRLVMLHRHYVRQMEERQKTASLIAQIARRLVYLPREVVNKEIESAFLQVQDFFDVDAVGLFEFSSSTTTLRWISSRAATDASQPTVVVDLDQFSWTASLALGVGPIVFSNVDELPSEANALKQILSANHIQSFAGFPLVGTSGLIGVLSFSTTRYERTWTPDDIRALTEISQIFGGALGRMRTDEAAHVSQQRLAGIVESAVDAVIGVDADQRIVVFNAAAEKIFGCSVDEAVGSSLDRFIPGRIRAQHGANVLRFGESGSGLRAMGGIIDVTGLRANGEEFPIQASISQVRTAHGTLFTAIIRDHTEHERAERELNQSYQLNLSILQSLKNHLAVLDSAGTIIATTPRGPEFIAASGINLLEFRVGDNYLEVCKAVAESGDQDVATALDGVRSVYERKVKYFEMRYDYEDGIDKKCFLMTVVPMKHPGRGIVISHEDITLRKRHEQAIHELNGRLINAQEEERRRIARELHDDISQQVAMFAIDLQQLKTLFPKELTEGLARVDVLWEKTHALSLDIQHLSHQLHSTKLDHLGIAAALRGLCSEVSEQCKIAIEFQFRRVPADVGTGVALSIFRVAQESLHNVAKHSQASNVLVELLGTTDSIMLRIKDDGSGFDSEENHGVNGLGMISMRERMRLVNGTLTVTSKPSSGTLIEARIPIHDGATSQSTEHPY
jgi:PAS domain S-box-containing protein